jgi:alcohol dehydrogenase, propanol-preferring
VPKVLVTAVSPNAFSRALGTLAKRGHHVSRRVATCSFELDIFERVLMRKAVRGSIVGSRLDLAK